MNGEWNRLKEAGMRCQPIAFDAATYGKKLWPIERRAVKTKKKVGVTI